METAICASWASSSTRRAFVKFALSQATALAVRLEGALPFIVCSRHIRMSER